MSKDPAILFYTSDFLTGTMTFSDSQVGKYIRLLCLQHQKGGYLSEQDMIKICGEKDVEIFEKFKHTNKGYFNERMLGEILKRKKHSEKQRDNVKKRWEKVVIPRYQNGITTVIPLENENENENINENSLKGVQGEKQKTEINIPFETFWNMYDKKRDKDKCAERWNSLTDIERKKAVDYIPAYKNATEKQFRKDPIRFLRSKSWNDEIISFQTQKPYQNITQPLNPARNENLRQIEHNLKQYESRTPEQIKLDTIGGDAIKYRILHPGHARQFTQDETIEMFMKGELTL